MVKTIDSGGKLFWLIYCLTYSFVFGSAFNISEPVSSFVELVIISIPVTVELICEKLRLVPSTQ